MSAPQSTYLDETHIVVDVTVTEVKQGCALGLILEHLDEAGTLVAAENLSTYVGPRAHQSITTLKGSTLRMKWILTGVKPSSTFGVIAQGMSSIPTSTVEGEGQDPNRSVSLDIDLTTLEGLQEYLANMKHVATAKI